MMEGNGSVPIVTTAPTPLPQSPNRAAKPASSFTPSPRPSICRTCLTVPGTNDAEGGGGPENPTTIHVRRHSARLLSLNVREALNQLRQKEHKARVTAVVQRNADYYRRQRCCECVTMMTVLVLFSIMSLYVIFAYGFYIGTREPFRLLQEGLVTKIKSQENSTVELWCQADTYWEWCRWIHYDRYCDYEWMPKEDGGVTEKECDFPQGKVQRIGDYERHQCGVKIMNLETRDRGLWMCEVEKYYPGFSRRYGELRTAAFTVIVIPRKKQNSSSTDVVPSSVKPNFKLDLFSKFADNPVTEGSDYTSSTASTTLFPDFTHTEDPNFDHEKYQKQFFLLKVFVLGGIGVVFAILIVVFWTYFMYLWRSFDTKRDHGSKEMEEDYAEVVDGAEFFGVQRRGGISADSEAAIALLESRRKSISFTVCTPVREEIGLDGESKLSFDITVRTVGDIGSSRSRSGSSVNTVEPVSEVIKVTVSPTPSNRMNLRRESLDQTRPPKPQRRLSLAPEDALLFQNKRMDQQRLWRSKGGGSWRAKRSAGIETCI